MTNLYITLSLIHRPHAKHLKQKVQLETYSYFIGVAIPMVLITYPGDECLLFTR